MTFPKITSRLLLALSLSAFAAVVFRCAWITDDAYITFRTVDNFIHGYGLTWNTAERVQVYTHPLWMFLVSTVYFFTREIFYSSIFLSFAVSLAAVLLLTVRLSASSESALLCTAILACSKAFVDYSTSGMENPLTHLLLALFFLVYFRPKIDFKALLLLSTIAAAGLLNRMDLLLIFAPALGYAAWEFHRLKGACAVLLGFLPFILWEAFSLFYYGFLLPNTAYAKLNTGIQSLPLAEQGLYYLYYSFRLDPLTPTIVAGGIALPFLTENRRHLPIVAGILLYLIYVVKIGGGFMSGRFLTAPLFCSVVLISQHRLPAVKKWAPAVASVVILSLCSPFTPLLSGADYGMEHGAMRDRGIEDQRGFLYRHAGLLSRQDRAQPTHSWAVKGRKARALGPCVPVEGAVGYYGFYAGPEAHILDIHALTDPLLARLPAINPVEWRIGHFVRKIPAGYNLKTVLYGQNEIRDRKLAAYYDKLATITRGDLFDPNRWIEIWNMNLGKYDNLLNFDYHWNQNHGLYLAKQGKKNDALRLLKASLSLDPDRADGWYMLAKFHQREGNLEEAHTALVRAIDLDSSQPAYWPQLLKLSRAYHARGRTDTALAVYGQALKLKRNGSRP